MSLLQDNRRIEGSSKKLYMICGIGIIVLLLIIVALLAIVTSLNNNKLKLFIDGQNYTAKEYLISKDNTIYIGLEKLTQTISKDGYTYKKGNRDYEDDNQCYITDSVLQESVFFKVGSNEIYKLNDSTNEVEQFKLSKPVIKENDKIYISLEDCKIALNMKYTKTKNQYSISTIEHLEKYYNQQASNSFTPDKSIVWETLASNKKMLKDGLVIVKDNVGNLGIATISSTTDSKKKTTKISTTQLITPKYKYIKYIEKYNQLVVETSSGRGIVELSKSSDGEYSVKTVIAPQYDDIKQLNGNMFIICEKDENNTSIKYGILSKNGEEILPTVYQKIGIDASQFTSNDIENGYLFFNYLIPIKKNDLWGFANVNGQIVIDFKYTDLGCTETNASSNVFIIPEDELIVIKEDKNYGIITKTGKVVVRPVLTKVYKESADGTDKYYMIYNDKKLDVLSYYDKIKNNVQKEVETVTEVKTNTEETANQTTESNTVEASTVTVVN